MQDGSVRELLRASATDADAVRQYLQSIDSDELNGLLDGIAPRNVKCQAQSKTKKEFLVQDDWLPLVHLLLQCEATRLRAACRIIQVLRRGAPSELESMQLLTEVNLGYGSALDELAELRRRPRLQFAVKRRTLLEEIDAVLDIVFSFLSEVVEEAKPDSAKVLPQLLRLVPYFLGMLTEISTEERSVAESLAKLLELPWKCQTVPSLLDVLVDDTSLMSSESWQQLQENVARMVTTSPEMASETMNPIIRACVVVANVTGEHKWIGIARYLLRQLPLHLRQEAEFNLQMSFHQSPRIVSLVCESIRFSALSDEDDVSMEDASNPFENPAASAVDVVPDWRDLFLLLHSLQASKPILHHRTSSSRVATEASVFAEIQQLSWWIVQNDVEDFVNSSASSPPDTGSVNKTVQKHVLGRVELLLNFGGKQIHAREWKALLLMDMAFYWLEPNCPIHEDDNSATSRPSMALMLLQAIFQSAPETRAEVLSCLFERSQNPSQRQIAETTLSQLFISQAATLFPHLNSIQDWLSVQFQRSFDSSRQFFLVASRLATVHKDLYNFLMVFLRKLLSTGNRLHQEFAVDMWCSWLDRRLPFNEQQEEEIISALKNSVTVCRDIQAWSFGRLEQLFHPTNVEMDGPAVSLRKSSWEELHRFLVHEIAEFIQPSGTGLTDDTTGDDEDSADEFGERDTELARFRFCSLDAFYRQNSSLDGAAILGLVFQKLLSCLISFGKAVISSKVSSDGLELGSISKMDRDVKEWIIGLVSNWKYFFHWICQDADDVLPSQPPRGKIDKSSWWQFLARIYIACAICNVAVEMLMRRQSTDSSEWGSSAGISIWSVMEVEFGLHRMVHKFAAQSAAEMDATLSKEYLRAAAYGLHRVLQPEKLTLLNAIKVNFQEGEATTALTNDRPDGISFDSVLFALDSCSSVLGEKDRYEALYPERNDNGREGGASSVLEALLSVYLCVRNRVMKMAKPASSDLPPEEKVLDNDHDDADTDMVSENKLRFSVYADSISAKFPRSARYLVTPARTAKTVVLLDAKSGVEILEHVCAAIGRTLEVMKTQDVLSTHNHVANLLRQTVWTRQSHQPLIQQNDCSNSFLSLARRFLDDVEDSIQLDGLTKLGVSCASLSKRLCDMGAELTDRTVISTEWQALSSVAYNILCDNVVYSPRLLRLLLSICLPTQLAQQLGAFVTMEPKIQGYVQACGLDTAASTNERQTLTHRKKGGQKSYVPGRRKRIRHEFDARAPNGLSVDSDSDASHSSSESDCLGSDDAVAAHDSMERIPHLNSEVSQNAAILAVLVVLEQSLSTLLSVLSCKTSGSPFPHQQEVLGCIRVHELVNRALSKNSGFSCGSRKMLLKMLHVIELGLRVGKAGGALRRSDDFTTDAAVRLFESSVMTSLRSRTWIDSIKDASEDSGTKTRVSATLLKMDIFFLQVPGTVQSLLKESTLDADSRERLKALVASVKEKIAPADQQRGKKAKQRLLGVVPIVKKRRKRLRSRHPVIDAYLNEENGGDAFADLEDFIE